jgi:alkylation response protein AidB-like acyl-CoA dehydrogenase
MAADGALLLAREAAWHHDHGLTSWRTAADLAYAHAAETAVRAAETCLHVHGGYGYTLEEMAAAGAPMEAVTVIITETIRRAGTAEQKERILRPVTRGEILLALGYTEPDAGSDLASAQTRAVRDGDGWLINGQKMFTTMGHLADYVFLLAQTDTEARKHRGLTMFLVPTTAEGFSASPIHTLSGERTNVTFYRDVRVGDDARVGQPGQGWEIVNLALAFERGGEFAAQLRRLVRAVVAWGAASGAGHDPAFQARLGRVTPPPRSSGCWRAGVAAALLLLGVTSEVLRGVLSRNGGSACRAFGSQPYGWL